MNAPTDHDTCTILRGNTPRGAIRFSLSGAVPGEFSSAKIVDNRYRLGSCTVGDSVNFNWRLIKAPMFVIDYVIVANWPT
jgi:hypothetical protein